MDVRMESAEEVAARNRKQNKTKQPRPMGKAVPSAKQAASLAEEGLVGREAEWLERLESDPASFGQVELEVHAQLRRGGDLFVAGLLAKAGKGRAMGEHVARTIHEAEVELRGVEKKDAR